MEVTPMSPSLASHTEWDNLCETDVTNMAIHSVTLLISLCGLVGNGAVLCSLRVKLHNAAICALACTDFLFLLFTVPSALLSLVEEVSCSPILPQWYVSYLFQVSVISCYWALFGLIFSNNIEYMDKLFMLCCHCDRPERRLRLVYHIQFWAFFALFTLIPQVINLCPSHQQQEHCRAAAISIRALILLHCAATTVISITIDFIKAKRGSRNQQPKRGNIIIFLMVLFILILSLCNFLQHLGYIVVSSDVLFLLNSIQSSIKPFTYFLAGGFQRPCSRRSLRLSLERVFEE
uniref:G-protein coupled receptors family 1 profile domain-containing protein n=1 Tax=Cyanoderma ruficeps TaxID=181631 RepID=A0A8C3NYD6_9PASS